MKYLAYKSTVVFLAGIAVMTLSAGCSTYKEFASDENIGVERINSESAQIMRANLYSMGTDKVILRGELRRSTTLRGKIPGYLRVELVNKDGNVFKEAEVNYTRKDSKSRVSLFSIPIPTETSLISSVRVIHYDTSLHTADSAKSVWLDVGTGK